MDIPCLALDVGMAPRDLRLDANLNISSYFYDSHWSDGRYQALLMRGTDKTVKQLAQEAGVTGSYFTRVLRLSFLAPTITKTILRNRHPLGLTAKRLANEIRLPLDWASQRALLGIA